MIDSPGAIEV